MIKKSVPAIFLFLNFIPLQGTFGQVPVSIPEYISQRFQSYCKSVPWDEVFIHTDREEYISGEDLWFKVYLIDRQNSRLSSNSKIVYFEILNPENRPVVQKKIFLENGSGPGQAVLPDTLSSGTYTIRAYTNWMKNFLPYNCFIKEIKVYNPYRTKIFRRTVRSEEIIRTVPDTSDIIPSLGLKVNNLKKDTLEIFIHSVEKFRNENKNLVYLFIQSHGIQKRLSTEKITADITKIVIPKKSLHSGVNQITIFDSKGPVCDRLIYIPVEENQPLTFNPTDSINKRSKVYFEIEPINKDSGISGLVNLSLSVSPFTDSLTITDFKDYLVLGSEFGFSSSGTIRGKKITELASAEIDSLMLTLKSHWIIWDSIFSEKARIFEFLPEKEYQYVTGRLLDDKLKPSSADEIVIMSVPGKNAVFQYTTTDANGNFSFRLNIDEQLKDLILQPDYMIKNQKVYIEPSFSDQYLLNKIYVDSITNRVPHNVSRQITNYQVSSVFNTSFTGNRITPELPGQKYKRFYGTPDFELNMNDFIRLDSMQEVFFELVPHVALEKIKTYFEMSVTDPSGNKLEGSPTVMIDGVIIKDLSVIARLDPTLVARIEVVWSKFRVGDYLFNGIINIISKTGDFSSGTLPVEAVRLHYNALDSVCSFVSPEYSSEKIKNSHLADYRNTLYWNPNVSRGEDRKTKIEFWTGDIKADYLLNIQGITLDGIPVSLRKILKVR